MAGLYAGYLLLSYVNGRLRLKVRQEIMTDLNRNAMKGILDMSLNRRVSLHSGDLVSRLTRDTEQLQAILPYGLSNAIRNITLSTVLLLVAFILNWKLSSLLFPIVPVAVFIYLRFDKALWGSAKAETKASGRKLALIQETIDADAEIKAYEAEDFFLEHSGKGVRDFEKKRFLRELYDTKVGVLILGAPMLAIVMIWYLGGRLVMANEITLGLIVTYTSTLTMIVPALVGIIEFFSSLPNEKTALGRIVQLFPNNSDSGPATKQSKQVCVQNLSHTNSILLQDVSFSYSKEYPLFKSLDQSLGNTLRGSSTATRYDYHIKLRIWRFFKFIRTDFRRCHISLASTHNLSV
jgi:ABC-type multidrug transport system fused ATPase/permease subunit